MTGSSHRTLWAAVLSAAVVGGGVTSLAYARPAKKAHHAPVVESSGAGDRLAEAHKEKDKAEKAFDATVTKLWASLEKEPEYVASASALKSAQDDYDSLTGPALRALESNPKYKAEADARDKAKAKLEAARATGQATDEEKAELAKDVLAHNAAVHTMEADALKKVSGVAAARARLTSAQGRLTQLRTKFAAGLKQNAEWSAAKSALDEAHKNVASAEGEVARVPDHTRGPVSANPIAANPRNAQPVVRQPIEAQPIVRQPVEAQPVVRQPVAGGPKDANPIAGGPKDANPIAGNPAPANPVPADPVNRQPVPGQPVPAQPVPGGPPNN